MRFRAIRHWLCVLSAVLGCGLLAGHAAEPEKTDGTGVPVKERQTAREALSWFNGWIGEWRGVGQVRRGSSQGAWRETSAFAWNFADGTATIDWRLKDGRHMESARIGWDVDAQRLTLAVKSADGATRSFTGRRTKDSVVFESAPDAEGLVAVIHMNLLNENRCVVLFEERRDGQNFSRRLGEVGCTREGTRLATSEGTGPECVVTGGAGTIRVSHEGRTWFVCCSGCRDAFEDDPKGILAEYQVKLETRRKADSKVQAAPGAPEPGN